MIVPSFSEFDGHDTSLGEHEKRYQKQLPNTRFRAISYGATRPRATNDTRRGRELNRRVELRIFRLRLTNRRTLPL